MWKWLIGISIAVLTGVILFWKVFSGKADKEAMKRALHEINQEKGQENIAKIEDDQTKILVDVKKAEQLESEKKEAIKKISEKAKREIDEVMKEADIGKVNDKINNELADF